MAAWCDDDQFYDRQEALGQSGDNEPYDWDECSVEELCASIDAAALSAARLADETALLTELVARRVA